MKLQSPGNPHKARRTGIGFDDLFPVPLSIDDGIKRRDDLETAISRIELDMKDYGRDDQAWHSLASKALWIKGEQLKVINRWLNDQSGIVRNLYERVEHWAATTRPDTPIVRSIEIEKHSIEHAEHGEITIQLYDPTEEYSAEDVAMSWREFQETVLKNQTVFA